MSGLVCDDWRQAPADTIARLLAAERQRWIDALHWDPAPALALLEEARQQGQAAGLIASDDEGRVAGWASYHLSQRRLQIAALVAASGEATRQLLDELLRTPEADLATDVVCFNFPGSPAFEGALARRRFEVTRYLYLQRALSPDTAAIASTSPLAPQLRAWTEEDGVATVRLLARAYAGQPAARAFAPRGTLEEWATYVAQIIKTPGCGRFLPAASVSAQHPADDRLRGILLATALQRDTAHIAQLAVDPSYRRKGLAAALVDDASRRAAAAGCWRLTLLVAEDNLPARQMYAGLGFEPTATFLYAARSAPNRMRTQRSGARQAVGV